MILRYAPYLTVSDPDLVLEKLKDRSKNRKMNCR